MPSLLQRCLSAFRRPWRAIPELDALSDDQGRALLRGLNERDLQRAERNPGGLTLIVLYLGLSVLTLALLAWTLPSNPWWYTTMLLIIILFPWRLDSYKLLRQAVNARLREDWCQGCAYALFELPASEGRIECPRCLRPCIAKESIRSAADLLTCDVEAHANRARRPRPKVVTSCDCGYPLHGLPEAEGSVTCPECGTLYTAAPRGFTRLDTQA